MNIEKAKLFATNAHSSINQKRKYTGENYIVHPIAVAELVKSISDDENMINAALLHDVIEDVYPVNTKFSIDLIRHEFGNDVTTLVIELTNLYTKNRFPFLNRKERKRLENDRMSRISPNAKTIKLADIIDNCKSIHFAGDFAEIYINEKREQLLILKEGNSILWDRAKEILYKEGNLCFE